VLSAGACAQSLYEPEAYRPLAVDHRARQLGDTVTVLIYEAASATSSANSAANRSSKIDLSATDLHNTIGGNFSSDNTFQGGGVERRTGEVVARVSVTVTEILPNGDLRVRGEQQIRLNTESQHIRIEGRLRPEDIDSDNTVLSSRLADARIDFKGRGLLSSRERPGWLMRFFQWIL
jgi:flagellar L-ring protein FlgH